MKFCAYCRFLAGFLLLSQLLFAFASCQSKNPYPPTETVGLQAESPLSDGQEGDWKYTLYSTYAGIAGYTGKGSVLTLPETLGGKTVRVICEDAFAGMEQLTEVTLPSTLIVIGRFAFDGCKNLTTVHFNEGLETVGAYSFRKCGLTSLDLPETLYAIGMEGFMANPLTEVILPESVTIVDEYAFHACTELKAVTLSPRLTSLANRLFDGCSSLTSFIVPETITEIGNYAFTGCTSLQTVVIPPSVQSLGTGVFAGAGSVTVQVKEEGIASTWCTRNGTAWSVASEEAWLSYYPKHK